VLEHIADLKPVFQKMKKLLTPGGKIYLGELHPFKQYSGSKARFETTEGTQVVPCFNHHITDFTKAAEEAGLQLNRMEEFFDNDDRNQIPRLLTLLFQERQTANADFIR
jgi:2-polyprenyl-3-methyl-5-hydroxy-6-metoxy-1,4-benzoquinol methylase